MADYAPRPAWRAEVSSVRSRMLTTLLVMVAVGMAGAGVVSFVLQRAAVEQGVNEDMSQEIAEIRQFALSDDPATGMPYVDLDVFFRTLFLTNVPSASESLGGLVDGRLSWIPAGQDRSSLEDPAVLEIARSAIGGTEIVSREVISGAREVRVAAVPVVLAGNPSTGVFVIVADLRPGREAVDSWLRSYFLVILITLVLTGVVGWVVAGRLLRPIAQLRLATEAISSSDLTRRVEIAGGDDDISHLARTFNDMLDRLEEAFTANRQFLDDAGHELRTPITILRGHLELVDPHDPDDVVATRDLLLDELDRMQRLVEDLMILSQSRRPDFVRPAPVELAAFTDDLMERLQHLGPQRWVREGAADGTIVADGQRLTQALLQLGANAAKFCPPDATISVGTAVLRDGRARLWVADDGPGMTQDEARTVFRRFARAGTGRGTEGSGLGLSIVDAIAVAHGGTVDLDTAPGRGATFTITVPPRLPDGHVVPEHREVPHR